MWDAVKGNIRATRQIKIANTDRSREQACRNRALVGDNALSKCYLRQRFGRYAVALLIAGDLLA
jgi:hypothetical protein